MADPTMPVVTDVVPGTPVQDPVAKLNETVVSAFKGYVEAAKTQRKSLHTEWKTNVELRMGRPSGVATAGVGTEGDIQSEINPDWSLTKTKTANLYSQTPTVQLLHEHTQYAAAVPPFMKALNYELGEKRARVGVAIEECLNDVVNAAGVGAIMVGYMARFEQVPVPKGDVSMIPPSQLQTMIQAGVVEMTTAERLVSDKFFTSRVSPKDLLWPKSFIGSDFDDADWVGRSGKMAWAEGKNEFKLDESVKEAVVGSGETRPDNDLRVSSEQGDSAPPIEDMTFDEIYYWRYRVDPDEKSFAAIWKLVFVHGMDKPAVHEPWKGQQYDPNTRKYVGACRFPLRFLTLTYISDNPIPPSDSSAGRPQVNDLRRSRSQMFMNRQRSLPLRGFDVNRIDLDIQAQLMKGEWQGMIPSNGDGSRAVWEVARASYPSEDLTFDQQTKADLMETWQVGPNQAGTMSSGEKTKAEVQTTQANFATRIGQERARVANFFMSAAEVLAGLMALYSDFPTLTEQERQAMQQAWNSKQILHELVFKIRPDAAIMLDTQTQVQRLTNFLNITVKSGYVNPEPIIAEIAELSGLDPGKVLKKPDPPAPPEPPKFTMSGKEDLQNPLILAMLIKYGQAPSPEEIDQAKKMLADVQAPVNPPGVAEPPKNEAGVDGQPAVPTEAHPEWSLGSRIMKRSRDMGGG